MENKNLYLWAENLEDYFSDNVPDSGGQVIEIKRLNFFIGKNNSGKSRFLRSLFKSQYSLKDNNCLRTEIESIIDKYSKNNNITYGDKVTFDGKQVEIYKSKWSIYVKVEDGSDAVPFTIDSIYDIFEQVKNLEQYPVFNYLKKVRDNLTELSRYKIEEISPEYPVPPEEYLYGRDNISFYKLPKNLQEQYQKEYLDECARIDYENSHLNFAESAEKAKNWDMFLSELSEYIKEESITKYYIPILRGMRPIQNESNVFPYITRTQKDYFKGVEHLESNQIITGENLYSSLQKQLLGKAQEWQRVRLYEQKLSQYFFNGETVTLIPELESDVLSIKIGKDEQFPISQLGDGLQQIIILTYQAFIEQDAVCSFFIEEPELHMHAGMVRQLMNFYLKETEHYYFFTTHSNHLLDMVDESDKVIIQKFVKQSDKQQNTSFQIYRCDRDRDLLASLGVKPSSVYLANCTIWVEGITDRLYLIKYMQKYLQELKKEKSEKYEQYNRFMQNYHYAFVEYSGGNIVHWDFSDDFADGLADKGLSAKAIVSDMLLIADGDNRDKAARLPTWNEELGKQNVVVLQSKEMENTLPFDVIVKVAKVRFESKWKNTKEGFDIEKLNELQDKNYFVNADLGIGLLLDTQIRLPETDKAKSVFADGGVGTIKDKLKFCREVIQYFDNNPDWELTAEARELCERIFQHIERCNSR